MTAPAAKVNLPRLSWKDFVKATRFREMEGTVSETYEYIQTGNGIWEAHMWHPQPRSLQEIAAERVAALLLSSKSTLLKDDVEELPPTLKTSIHLNQTRLKQISEQLSFCIDLLTIFPLPQQFVLHIRREKKCHHSSLHCDCKIFQLRLIRSSI